MKTTETRPTGTSFGRHSGPCRNQGNARLAPDSGFRGNAAWALSFVGQQEVKTSSRTQLLLRTWWPILLLGVAGCSIEHVVRLQDGQRIDVEQMIVEVRAAPVILIGERHDDVAHHELQLAVIRGLHKSGKPLVIAVEMFAVDSQPALDAWVAGNVAEDEFIRTYQANWRNLNWEFYRNIFVFARDHGIPLVALNAVPAVVEKVAQLGFASLSAIDLRTLPADSNSPLSAEELRFMTQFYPRHGKTGDALRHLCEAQALRNRVMAKGIIRYQTQHPEASMVVLTGGAHAWGKGGIPAELGTLSYKVIMPPLPGIAVAGPGANGADYLLD